MAVTGKKNEPCPCGSGKRYENCCLLTDALPAGRMDAKEYGKAVLGLLENRQFSSLAEAQAFLDQANAAYNDAPMDDFSCLSPAEMYRFLYQPFDSPGLIDYNFEIRRFPDAPFFRLFSYLMKGVATEDLKVTVNGNLPQKFVQSAAPWYFGEKKYDEMRRYTSFWTETDIMALHTVRLNCRTGGIHQKIQEAF